MDKVNVSTLKNNLSKVLRKVRKGEAIIIVDRDEPIAKLTQITAQDESGDDELLMKDLERRGIVSVPKSRKRMTAKELEKHRIKCSGSALEALLKEREESPF